MKKNIHTSMLTSNLYMNLVKPAMIKARIAVEVTENGAFGQYTVLFTEEAAADEIMHCMYVACMNASNKGTSEEEAFLDALKVSAEYRRDALPFISALYEAVREILFPETATEKPDARTEYKQDRRNLKAAYKRYAADEARADKPSHGEYWRLIRFLMIKYRRRHVWQVLDWI